MIKKNFINKKVLNVIVFNIPENISNSSVYLLKEAKTDFRTIQKILGHNKLNKSILNTMAVIKKYNKTYCYKTSESK